jgi:hypothetical protein
MPVAFLVALADGVVRYELRQATSEMSSVPPPAVVRTAGAAE